MSDDTVISVEGLSKRYRLGQIGGTTLREDVSRWWARLRGQPDPTLRVDQVARSREHGARSPTPTAQSRPEARAQSSVPPADASSSGSSAALQAPRSELPARAPARSDYVWALKDVSFEVKRGDVLGIIGRNGAGKSTLLKILSRITAPTEGHVKVKGRIASLLEIGTGMHPELTGRENIFLNGAILGMTKAEIAGKLDEIVEFSGVERFIDTPVKRYSSGMMVRLGFAVAAHLEPEILIVDEVLAVGDAEFQKKCLGKMQDVAGHGRTVLFVSHNMTAVRGLCPKAICLDQGTLADRGGAAEVIAAYLNSGSHSVLRLCWDRPEDAPGVDGARIRTMELTYPGRDEGAPIHTNTPIAVTYEFWHGGGSPDVNVSTHLRDATGEVVFNVWSRSGVFPPGLLRGEMRIPPDLLNDGQYTLDFMVVHDSRIVSHLRPGLRFEVHDYREAGGWHGKVLGAVRPTFLSFGLHHVPA